MPPSALQEGSRLLDALRGVVGARHVLTSESRTRFYRQGIKVGGGEALAVVLPQTPIEMWRALEVCVAADVIILMQAANTGVTGGSTPDGADYDRPIVIINTLAIDDIVLLNGGAQALAFAGATLYQLEDRLAPIHRTPHSVIGSSCIGASIVGGICNNSGGNLVNRGPAYTELSLFAQKGEDGALRLVNHLGIELGEKPEEILANLEARRFDPEAVPDGPGQASDREYEGRVREIDSDSPARFNADPRRLHEASGCAGKVAVFAVRVDTFAEPEQERVFYVGTNDPTELTALRRHILENFDELPEMGEYIHRSYFDASDRYCKDTFLFLSFFHPSLLPKLFAWKARVDAFFANIPFAPRNVSDRVLQVFANLMPDHLPKRLRDYRDRFEHMLMLKANDAVIGPTERLLREFFGDSPGGEWFACTEAEGEKALLHRFVAGGASGRAAIVHANEVEGLMPLDIALRRNDDEWHLALSPDVESQLAGPYVLAHFFCHVFHWDFVVKKGVDIEALKARVLRSLDERGAQYPAEHNVGHLYSAEPALVDHYRSLDPSNAFNPGVGRTSRKRDYA